LCARQEPAYTCLTACGRPTSEIVARRYLRSPDTTTLQVPSTRRATLGDRAFPVPAARAWNSLPPETRPLLNCDISEGDQVLPLSSVIRLTWRFRPSASVCNRGHFSSNSIIIITHEKKNACSLANRLIVTNTIQCHSRSCRLTHEMPNDSTQVRLSERMHEHHRRTQSESDVRTELHWHKP